MRWVVSYPYKGLSIVQAHALILHSIASVRKTQAARKIAPYHHDYPYKEIDRVAEKKILSDYNCQVIHTSPEYQTNLDFNTPTNRILTSMCSPERLLYIIRYGIAYVRMEREVEARLNLPTKSISCVTSNCLHHWLFVRNLPRE